MLAYQYVAWGACFFFAAGALVNMAEAIVSGRRHGSGNNGNVIAHLACTGVACAFAIVALI